jgi:hypothetical protein
MGMNNDENKEQKDHMRMNNDENKEQKDHVGMNNDENKEQKDHVGMNNDENKEQKDHMGMKNVYVPLVISIILFILALLLYFNSNPIEYNSPLDNSSVEIEFQYIEQAKKNLYDKDMAIALIVKNKIKDEILEYKNNSEKFANDILDIGSSSKIIWYQIKDFFGNKFKKDEENDEEKSSVEYIKKIYYQYMFDENDIAKIIEENIEYFNSLHKQALNTEISNLTNKLMNINLSSDYIKELLESEFNIEIDIDDLSKPIQDNVLINSAFSAASFFGTDAIVSVLINKLAGTGASVLAGASGAAITFGTSIVVSIIVDVAINNNSKKKITQEINEKIDDIATIISEEVYNKIIFTIQ